MWSCEEKTDPVIQCYEDICCICRGGFLELEDWPENPNNEPLTIKKLACGHKMHKHCFDTISALTAVPMAKQVAVIVNDGPQEQVKIKDIEKPEKMVANALKRDNEVVNEATNEAPYLPTRPNNRLIDWNGLNDSAPRRFAGFTPG